MTDGLYENQNDKGKEKCIDGLPKNIKQIGDLSSDKKIFIEDYAFTYMNSVAYGNNCEEGAGVLLGESVEDGNEKNIFIKGIIKIKNASEHKGIYFDQTTWRFIYSDIEKYFPKLEIVGWFAYMPVVNPDKMQFLGRIHKNNFSGGTKTLYLINSSDKEGDFYLFEKNRLVKQNGYVCYYEKNYEMQEYMIEKRGNKSIEDTTNDRVVKNIRNVIREKEERKEQRKQNILVYGTMICMTIAIAAVSVGFMNSYEKIKSFDQSINNMVNEMGNLSNRDSVNVSAQVAETTAETTADTQSDIVKVNKLEGNVYPQKETESVKETQEQTESTTPSQSGNYDIYVVKKGDTIMSICKNYYGSYARYKEVMDFNNIYDATHILIGQEIELPQ